jgi:hypothetical protein
MEKVIPTLLKLAGSLPNDARSLVVSGGGRYDQRRERFNAVNDELARLERKLKDVGPPAPRPRLKCDPGEWRFDVCDAFAQVVQLSRELIEEALRICAALDAMDRRSATYTGARTDALRAIDAFAARLNAARGRLARLNGRADYSPKRQAPQTQEPGPQAGPPARAEGVPLSRLDLPPIVEALRELHRIIEHPPKENWQVPAWLVRQYEQTTAGAAGLPTKPGHAWLINVAADEVLNRIMPPFAHTKPDCPEIAHSLLDMRHKVTLINLRELLSSFALGEKLVGNRCDALQVLDYLEAAIVKLADGQDGNAADASRDQGKSAQSEGEGQSDGSDSTPELPNAPELAPSRQKAYAQYLSAVGQAPDLAGGTVRAVYEWLEKHNDDDPLPPFATWERYVREARASLGTGKHRPRMGREHGRSIVRREDL